MLPDTATPLGSPSHGKTSQIWGPSASKETMAWGKIMGITAAREIFESKKKSFGRKHAEVVGPYIALGRAYLNFGRRAADTSKKQSLTVAAQIFEQCFILSRSLQDRKSASEPLSQVDMKLMQELGQYIHYCALFAADCHNLLGDSERAEAICVEALAAATQQHDTIGSSQHLIEVLNSLWGIKVGQKNFRQARFCLKRSIELAIEALGKDSSGFARQMANIGDSFHYMSQQQKEHEDPDCYLECALACFKHSLPNLDHDEQDVARFGAGGRKSDVAGRIDLILKRIGNRPSNSKISTIEHVVAHLSCLDGDLNSESFLQRFTTSKTCVVTPAAKEEFAVSSFSHIESQLCQESEAGKGVDEKVDEGQGKKSLTLGSRVRVQCERNLGERTVGTCIELSQDAATIGLSCGREISVPKAEATVVETTTLVADFCSATGLSRDRVHVLGPKLNRVLEDDPAKEPSTCAAEEVLELCFGIIEHAQECMSLSMEIERAEFSIALDCGFWGLGLARGEDNQDLIARALNLLGNAFDGLRMYQHAEGKYKQALAAIEQSWLSAIPHRAVPTHANLSITLFKLGKLSEGETHFRKGRPEFAEAEIQKHLQTTAKNFRDYGSMNARGGAAFCLCTESPDADPTRKSMLFMGRLHQAGVIVVPGLGRPRDQQPVQLCGLRNKPDLNEATGKVQGFAEGALAVALDACPGRVVKIKPAKLRVLNLKSRFAQQPQAGAKPKSASSPKHGVANERDEGKNSEQTRADSLVQNKAAAGSNGLEHLEKMAKAAEGAPGMHPSVDELKHGRNSSQGSSMPEQRSPSRAEDLRSSKEAEEGAAKASTAASSAVPEALVRGVRVRLQNLKRGELNGEEGDVRAEKDSDGRYHVRLSSGRHVLVKAENCACLRRAADAASSSAQAQAQHQGWTAQYLALHSRARELTNYKGREQVQASREAAEAATQAWAEFRQSAEGEGDGGGSDRESDAWAPSVGMRLACLLFDSLFSLCENVEAKGLEALLDETAARAEVALDAVQRLGGYLETTTSSVNLSCLVGHRARVVAPAAGPGAESQPEVRLIEGTPFQLWSTNARAWILNWRSSALHKLGEYGRGLTFAEAAAAQIAALKSSEMQSAANPIAQHMVGCQLNVEVACDHNLARSYRRCGKVQQAIDVTKASLDKVAAFEAELPAPGTMQTMLLGLRAHALMNLGAYHFDVGAYEHAAAYNKRALELCARHPDAVAAYPRFECIVLGNQANALGRLGHVDEAQAHRRKAIERLEPHASDKAARASLARIKCAYASALPMNGGSEEAVRELEAAYAAAQSTEEAVLVPTIALSLAQRVRTVQGRRGVARAEELLQEGLEVCERMQASLAGNDELRISIFKKQQSLYTELQRLLISADRPHDALCAAERAKARALAHLVQPEPHSAAADSGSEVSWALLQELARAEGCTVLFFSMGEANAMGEPAAIWSWVMSGAGELLRFQATRLSREREYQVQGIPDEARGAFAGAESRGGWCSVAEDAARGRVSVVDDSETTRLRAWYELLLRPVVAALPTTGELLIIPHHQLFMVPWAALIDGSKDKRYLVESLAIRLSPSLRIAHAARLLTDLPQATSKKVFVGNPWPIPSSLDGLKALPYAEDEVRLVTQELAARGCRDTLCATGADATKERVRRMAADAGWVHLACHGLLEEKALVLAGGDSASALLTMEEVQEAAGRMRQGATVVLSACNSACGEICGEGVVGLARSFLAAGASAALVSLWQIPDRSTMAFMLGLYRRLQAGMLLPQATRMAMLSMAGRAPAPASDQESQLICSWTSEQGRAEQAVVETLFNNSQPLAFEGKPLAVGSGLSESGHLTAAAHEAIFGADTDKDGRHRNVWGWNGAARTRILAGDAGVLQDALGSTVCASGGSAARCSHARCARRQRPSGGLLLLLHLHVHGGGQLGAPGDAAAEMPSLPWLEETILLVQEQLSLRFATEGGASDGTQPAAARSPKHWAPFVLIGASTAWPPHLARAV